MTSKGIICANCGSTESEVLHTRRGDDEIRRRRACSNCGGKFTTWETAEPPRKVDLPKGKK